MSPARQLAAAALITVMIGSLAVTGGTAWYLRSGVYRRAAAELLSANLALPAEIGAVVPRSWRTREYRDITVWLPQRRDEALTCRRALVRLTPAPGRPDAYEIELFGGTAEISTRTWLSQDYRGVIESGLRPGFAPGGPERLRFERMAVRFERDGFELRLEDAAGMVEFPSDTQGLARATARRLNGYSCPQPVLLTGEFSPREQGIQIDDLTLVVPELPLAVLSLRRLVGADVRRGHFGGRLRYREHPRGAELLVSGRCRDVELEECTAGWLPTPWQGRCVEAELQELRIAGDGPQSVRFRGRLEDLRLENILATWSLHAGEAKAELEVGAAEVSRGGVDRFVSSGRCTRVSLEALTDSLGMGGRMTGTLGITIHDLTIESNRLKSLDATLTVDDAEDAPNWIDGALLRALAEKALHVRLPNILPSRIEYTQLGLRLEVRDEVLHVYGTHGPGERTILTVRVAGQDFPLLFEPRQPIDLSELADWLRTRAAERLRQRLVYPRSSSAPAP